jgi:hypothetical protein
VTDGTSAMSTVGFLYSVFKLSRVVDPGANLEGDSAGISSKDDNAPSLRCSDEGLRCMSLMGYIYIYHTRHTLCPTWTWSQEPINR